MVTALKDAGIEMEEDVTWDTLLLNISSYKAIHISEAVDALELAGGFSSELSANNGIWGGSPIYGTVISLSGIDFTNIKKVTITHYLNKYNESGTLPITSTVGIANLDGSWVSSFYISRTLNGNDEQQATYAESFDTTELTGIYYIQWNYKMYSYTNGSIENIYINA